MTKFFSGHADVMGGCVVINDEQLANKIAFYQNAEGTALAPFDCWLFLRGIKTMYIRYVHFVLISGVCTKVYPKRVIQKQFIILFG